MRCVSSVVYDEATHTQRFFGAHGDDVTCLAFHRAALPAEVLTGVKDGVVAQFVRSQATKTSTVAL